MLKIFSKLFQTFFQKISRQKFPAKFFRRNFFGHVLDENQLFLSESYENVFQFLFIIFMEGPVGGRRRIAERGRLWRIIRRVQNDNGDITVTGEMEVFPPVSSRAVFGTLPRGIFTFGCCFLWVLEKIVRKFRWKVRRHFNADINTIRDRTEV